MSIREIREKARRDLHLRMSVPAVYVPPSGGATVELRVRVHDGHGVARGLDGDGYIHVADRQTKIIILMEDVASPERLARISIAAGEAYRVDNIEKPDGITRTLVVTRLDGADAAGLPLPGVSG